MAEIITVADAIGVRVRAGMGHNSVVFTNGVFDVLHLGHLRTLRFARKLGDILIVAVNTDESVRALKGPFRPINSLASRLEMLQALGLIDYLVPFGSAEDPSVESLIEALQPDVLVKGGDYSPDGVVGAAIVTKHGGRTVIAPKVPDVSTTATVEKMGHAVDGMDGDGLRKATRQMAAESPTERLKPGSVIYGGRPVIAPKMPDTDCDTLELAIDAPTGFWDPSIETNHPSSAFNFSPWVFVDLDGVLVDFVGSMARALGREWNPDECRGEYDPGKMFGCRTDLFSVFGADFWETASWMRDGAAIWGTVLNAVDPDRILLCSSPTHETASPMGKLRWIERHVDLHWMRRYIFTPVKAALASPSAILIDDSDKQVNAFRKAGGTAILVPRPWNSMWKEVPHIPDVAAWVGQKLRGAIEKIAERDDPSPDPARNTGLKHREQLSKVRAKMSDLTVHPYIREHMGIQAMLQWAGFAIEDTLKDDYGWVERKERTL